MKKRRCAECKRAAKPGYSRCLEHVLALVAQAFSGQTT